MRDIKGGRSATPRSTSPSVPAVKGETKMLSWGTKANIAVLIVACSAALGWGVPSTEAEAMLEDRIRAYLRNGYSRSHRTTDDMFLR